MSEDYVTDLAEAVVKGVIVIGLTVVAYYGLMKYVDWQMTRKPKK